MSDQKSNFTVFLFSFIMIISLLLAMNTFAQNHKGLIAVIEYKGSANYSATLGDGSKNHADRYAIAQDFYSFNGDNYDFLCIFTTFPVDLTDPNHQDVLGRHWGVQNSVQGLGRKISDNTNLFGSSGRLKGFIDMGFVTGYGLKPGHPDFHTTMMVLCHETGHQWLAYSGVSLGLLTNDKAHWNYLFDTDGSFLYGCDWEETSPGTYTCQSVKERFSPLDLYLMGLFPPEDVQPMTLIYKPDFIPPSYFPFVGDMVTETADSPQITIGDIINEVGQRKPDHINSQKEFRMAFIILYKDGYPVDPGIIEGVNAVRRYFPIEFFRKTYGRALIQMQLFEAPDASDPMGQLDLDVAHNWLLDKQDGNGCWSAGEDLSLRDTQTALGYLTSIGIDNNAQQNGISCLVNLTIEDNDDLSRSIIAIAQAGNDPGRLVDDLLSIQNPDGGWSVNGRYLSDAFDTGLAVKALITVDPNRHQDAIKQGISWLLSSQREDGAWSDTHHQGLVLPTLHAVRALMAYPDQAQVEDEISLAFSWLTGKIHMPDKGGDGGIGDIESTIIQSALYLALAIEKGLPPAMIDPVVQFISERQEAEGSWQQNVYPTALATKALSLCILPDITVEDADIQLAYDEIYEGQKNEIRVEVRNLGIETASNIAVRAYLTNSGILIDQEKRISELMGGNYETVFFSFLPIGVQGPERIEIIVDPDNTIFESKEGNNIALKDIVINSAPDTAELSISNSEIAFIPESLVTIPQSQTIKGILHNFGNLDAANVLVQLFLADPNAEGSLIDEKFIDVGSLSQTEFSFDTFNIETIGSHIFYILVNPNQTIEEMDYSNNRASNYLLDNIDYLPDLAIDPNDFFAEKSSLTVGDEVIFFVNIHNRGTQLAQDVLVQLAYDNGEQSGIIHKTPITVDYNNTETVECRWIPVYPGDPTDITARINPGNDLPESDYANNEESIQLSVFASDKSNYRITYEDISFDPPIPDSGDTVNIDVTVHNVAGVNTPPGTPVHFYHDDPNDPNNLIDTYELGIIPAKGSESASITWTVIVNTDTTIYCIVNQDRGVEEFSYDDNMAFQILSVNTLPDLELQAAISLDSAYPKTGDQLKIGVILKNIGKQHAPNASVRCYLGDPQDGNIIGNELLFTNVPAEDLVKDTIMVDTNNMAGETTFTLVAGMDGSVIEGDPNNNQVVLNIIIQKTNLWLSSRYFSPNGDGVLDDITLYFGDMNPSEVTIINELNNTITVLTPEPGNNFVTWDGRNQLGFISEDGNYFFVIGYQQRGFVLDTNRSSMNPVFDHPNLNKYLQHQQILYEHEYSKYSWGFGRKNNSFYMLYYDKTNRDLFLGKVENQALTPISPPVSFTYPYSWHLLFSPLDITGDENYAIFTGVNFSSETPDFAEESDIYLIDLSENEPTPQLIKAGALITDIFHYGFETVDINKMRRVKGIWPQLSPDGKEILYVAAENGQIELRVMDLSGQDMDTITLLEQANHIAKLTCYYGEPVPNYSASIGEYLWSPSGDQIAYIDGDLYTINRDKTGKRAWNVATGEDEAIWNLHWDHFGHGIAFLHGEVEGELHDDCSYNKNYVNNRPFYLDLDTGSIRSLPTIPPYNISLDSILFDRNNQHYIYNKKVSRSDGSLHLPLPEGLVILGFSPDYSNALTEFPRDCITTTIFNMVADLRLTGLFGMSGIQIRGSAHDLNFDGFQLEYALLDGQDDFQPLGPVYDTPLVGDAIMNWLPPKAGDFVVRLRVWDKAGNSREVVKTVNWSGGNEIANIALSERYISPGVIDSQKDNLIISYTGLVNPLNFTVSIYNEDNDPVWELPVSHTEEPPFNGEIYFNGVGNVDSGEYDDVTLDDGEYTVRINEFEARFIIDNTAPEAEFNISEPTFKSNLNEKTMKYSVSWKSEVSYRADDDNLLAWDIEYKPIGDPNYYWNSDRSFRGNRSEPIFKDKDQTQPYVTTWGPNSLSGRQYRLFVEDKAGNRNIIYAPVVQERLVILANGPNVNPIEGTLPSPIVLTKKIPFTFIETIKPGLQSVSLEYQETGSSFWKTITQKTDPSPRGIDKLILDIGDIPGGKLKLRIRALDEEGREFTSQTINVVVAVVKILDVEPLPQKLKITVKNYYNKTVVFDTVLLHTRVRFLVNCKREKCAISSDRFTDKLYRWKRSRVKQNIWPYSLRDQDLLLIPQEAKTFYLVHNYGGVIDKIKGVAFDFNQNEIEVNVLEKDIPGKDIYFSIAENPNPNYITFNIRNIADPFGVPIESLNVIYNLPGHDTYTYTIDNPEADKEYPIVIDVSNSTQTSICLEDFQGDISGFNQYSIGTDGFLSFEEFFIDFADGEFYMEYGKTLDLLCNQHGYDPIIIDNTPPVVNILQPSTQAELCPEMKIIDGEEKWGISIITHIEEEHLDDIKFYYGKSDKPDQWYIFSHVKKDFQPGEFTRFWNIGWNTDWGDYALKVAAWDKNNNYGDDTVTFYYHGKVRLNTIAVVIPGDPNVFDLSDEKILSPLNQDGLFDSLTISFEVDQVRSAWITASVFDATNSVVTTILQSEPFSSGPVSIIWDGTVTQSNAWAADGRYSIRIEAVDFCQFRDEIDCENVIIDNSPPALKIFKPMPESDLAPVTEFFGYADDLHFESFRIGYGMGEFPFEYIELADSVNPIPVYGSLGILNAYQLEPGTISIRLYSRDQVKNSAELIYTYNLPSYELIQNITVTPEYISPDGDNIQDIANIQVVLGNDTKLNLTVLDDTNNIVRTLASEEPHGTGKISFNWDGTGTDDSGTLVDDGPYTIQLKAAGGPNGTITEQVSLSIVVDTMSPEITPTSPENESCTVSPVEIVGSITDMNLLDYTVYLSSFSDPGDPRTIDTGTISRTDFLFKTLDDLEDGTYVISFEAQDKAGNVKYDSVEFTLDATNPQIRFEEPVDQEFRGVNDLICNVRAVIQEQNITGLDLLYGEGPDPNDLTLLIHYDELLINYDEHPGPVSLFEWDLSTLNDGVYSLILTVADCSSHTIAQKVTFTLDKTPPEAAITSPIENQVVSQTFAITGTARDKNLMYYKILLSPGKGSEANQFTLLAKREEPIVDGTLLPLGFLPPDGAYTIRLSVLDEAKNTSLLDRVFWVNTAPPGPPINLEASAFNNDVYLTWYPPSDLDVMGYHIYRDGERITIDPVENTEHIDNNLSDGVYEYKVAAIDFGDLEGARSDPAVANVDSTPPVAVITCPADGVSVGPQVFILGDAHGTNPNDFKEYQVAIGAGSLPTEYSDLQRSSIEVYGGALAEWTTVGLSGTYTIRLRVYDNANNYSEAYATVKIDHNLPPSPVLNVLQNTPPGSSTVHLEWTMPSDPGDIRGFLIYRNGKPFNAPDEVLGDISPYIIEASAPYSYDHRNVPDGTHEYYVIAVDEAMLLSAPSNSLTITLDEKDPNIIIIYPEDYSNVGGTLFCQAECIDEDVNTVVFKYYENDGGSWYWVQIGDPVTSPPWKSGSFTLPEYRQYDLQAIVTDLNNKTGKHRIKVYNHDITTPPIPENLTYAIDETSVVLSWDPVTDPGDLAGYHVYRDDVLISGLVTTTHFYDDPADGTYIYTVTSVDTEEGYYNPKNESDHSNSLTINLFTPLVESFFPIVQDSVALKVSNILSGHTVEVIDGEKENRVADGTADTEGRITFILSDYEEGMYYFYIRGYGAYQPYFRESEEILVIFNDPPGTPTDFKTIDDVAGTINLSWSPVPDADVFLYRLRLNGEIINENKAPITTYDSITASPSSTFAPPENAFDQDADRTCWEPDYSTAKLPFVWQVKFEDPYLIQELEIKWDINYARYAIARDYDIYGFIGEEIVRLAWMRQNEEMLNHIRLPIPVALKGIRIRVLSTYSGYLNGADRLRLYEVTLSGAPSSLMTTDSFAYTYDGEYRFHVSAQDAYGAESGPSEEAVIAIGSMQPSGPPQNLTVSPVSGGKALALSWLQPDPNTSVIGYAIYRSETSGGPYQRITSKPITETNMTDTGLMNRQTYSYVATAFLTPYLESDHSNEASGTPCDTLQPAPPLLYYPTKSGMPITVSESPIDIYGYAETSDTIGLFNYNQYLGEVPTINKEGASVSINFGEYIEQWFVLPEAKNAIITDNNGFLKIFHLKDGTVTLIDDTSPASKRDFSTSRNGKRLAYREDKLIKVYDLASQKIRTVVDDDFYNYSPLISPDGGYVYYPSDDNGNQKLFVINIETNDINPITGNTDENNEYLLTVSPGGRYLAFMRYDLIIKESFLFIYDLETATEIPVGLPTNDMDDLFAQFRYDSNALFYLIAYEDPVTMDFIQILRCFWIDSQTQEDLVTFEGYEYGGICSIRPLPDGQRILMTGYNGIAYLYDTQSSQLTYLPRMPGFDETQVSSQGWIYSSEVDDSVTVYYLIPGQFVFKGVELNPGPNLFSALATDTCQNYSDFSEPIEVDYDLPPSRVDLALYETLLIYPNALASGETVFIQADIYNNGTQAVNSFNITFYYRPDGGYAQELETLSINNDLQPGEWNAAAIHWTTTGFAGCYDVSAIVDPLDSLNETSEENNISRSSLNITGAEGVYVEVSLDRRFFPYGEEVPISVVVLNSGVEDSFTVTTTIEDENNKVLGIVDNRTFENFGYGASEQVYLSWNALGVEPGDYRIHVTATDDSGIVSEDYADFTITLDIVISCNVTTDKPIYLAGVTANITARIINATAGHTVEGLKVNLSIKDSLNTIAYERADMIEDLPGDALTSLFYQWSTDTALPGEYSAYAEVHDTDQNLVASDSVTINVTSPGLTSLSGHIIDLVAEVGYTEPIDFSVEMKNNGYDTLPDIQYAVTLLDIDQNFIVNEVNGSLNLNSSETATIAHSFTSDDLDWRLYLLILSASKIINHEMHTEVLDTAPVKITDIHAPQITVESPIDQNCYTSHIKLSVLGTDDLSGINKVYYTINGSGYQYPLPLVNGSPNDGTFEADWNLGPDEPCSYTIEFRAEDLLGNVSDPVQITIYTECRFDESDLIRVIYMPGEEEVVTYLGRIGTTFDFTEKDIVVGGGSDAFQLSDFVSATGWSDLYIAYFAKNHTSTAPHDQREVWLTIDTNSTTPVVNLEQFNNFNEDVDIFQTYYRGLAGGIKNKVIANTTYVNSYYQKMDFDGSSLGTYGGYLTTGLGEMNLVSLATDGYVDMYLYYFKNDTLQNSGSPIAFIRSMADGSTIINPSLSVNIEKGWNMISLPVLPYNASISKLFPEAVVVYGYKKESGYVRVEKHEELKAGTGYWILLNEEKRHRLIGQTILEYNLSVNEERWYMIGGCTYQAKASVKNGKIGVIYRYVQGIGYQRVNKTESIMPGKGYWILLSDIKNQAELTVKTTGHLNP